MVDIKKMFEWVIGGRYFYDGKTLWLDYTKQELPLRNGAYTVYDKFLGVSSIGKLTIDQEYAKLMK